jgi:hypothetical protein
VSLLWLAQLSVGLERQPAVPFQLSLMPFVQLGIGLAIIEGLAIAIGRTAGPAPDARLERREWMVAFWWSVGPNLFLVGTALLTMFT